ncbi:hypothetical protein EBT25_04495 [bacterium]|nr:hypothetical protein [bacterium]
MIMSIDTYGLSSEQYTEFFHNNLRFAAKLYLDTCNILSSEGVGNVDFKTVSDMYQEAVYTTNDDCRRYQKSNNPEALKEVTADLYGISPSREELMDEIQSLSAKVESLVDYIGNLVTITTAGLEGIATTLDDKVD